MRSKIFVFVAAFVCLLSFAGMAKAELYSNPEAVKYLTKCLKEEGAVMYGTKTCGHCKQQMESFGTYFKNVEFVDCRATAEGQAACRRAKVGKFPQWNFTNGSKIVREANLDTIASQSGCDDYVIAALGGDDPREALRAAANKQTSTSNSSYTASISSTNTTQTQFTSSSNFGTPEDLASCLKQKGVYFYGSPNCGHCNKQKAMFEGAFEAQLSSNLKNCKGSDESECRKINSYPFPTWYQPSTGTKLPGPEKSLASISKAFSCGLPDPSLASNSNSSFAQSSFSAPASSSQQVASFDYFEQKAQTTTEQPVPATTYSQSSYNPQASNLASQPQLDQNLGQANFERAQAPTESYLSAYASGAGNANQVGNALENSQYRMAQCLASKKAVLYGNTNAADPSAGSYKSTFLQMREFGVAADQIKVIDCSSGAAECQSLLALPTWVWTESGEVRQLAGFFDLNDLARAISCPLP